MNKQQAQRARHRQWLDEVKNVPCADCGERYPPRTFTSGRAITRSATDDY